MKNLQDIINRLNILEETKQYEELLNQTERFIAEEDDFAPFYLFKGNALRSLNQPEKAIEAYQDAIASDPNDALARTALGRILFEKGDYINALNACDGAILIDNGFPDPYVYSANVLVALGYPEQAVFAYHRAYMLDPSSEDLGELVGTLFAREGELKETGEVFFSLIQNNPTNETLYIKMIVCLFYLLQNGASHKDISEYASSLRQMFTKNEFISLTTNALINNQIDFDPLTPQAVNTLFNVYASSYDSSMEGAETEVLQEINNILVKLYEPHTLDICDLGCGTGSVGKLLRNFSKDMGLIGVDLCSAMLDKAYDKKIYDKFFHAENTSFLKQNPNTFDLITSVDVFSYMKSFQNQIKAVKGALKSNGCFIFTFRKNTLNQQDIFLYPPYYYLYGEKYVEKTLKEEGFSLQEMRSVVLDERIDQSAENVLCVAQKIG